MPEHRSSRALPRTIVVGGGIMGLSAAWALGRRGHRVTLLEQGPIPNPLGSSVDDHRLIRFTYGAEAGYSAMVADAYDAWERLWGDLGRSLYHPTGTLCVGRHEHGWMDDSAATLAALDHPIEWLEPADLAAEYPLIAMQDLERAFLARTGGVLLAGAIVEALAEHLAASGVEIRTQAAVTEIDPEAGHVALADGTRLEADHLVVAAGPWAGRLVPDLAPRVTPSRQIVVYLAVDGVLRDRWAGMPMVLDIDPASGFYLVPPVGQTRLKIGDHRFSLTGDPDRDREAARDEAEAFFEMARIRLAEPERYRIAQAKTCFYAVTEAERFIVEPLGSRGVVLTGFSGHGFKFGPLVGEAAARLLTGEADPALVTRWAAGLTAPGEVSFGEPGEG